MREATAMKLEPKKSATVPLSERGRIMYVHDVRELIGKDAHGNYVKSEWWILNSFARDRRKKMGRTVYWWEKDVIEALDNEEFA